MQYKIIDGVIFSEFEINDKEKIKKVLKDVQVLNDRTKTFATLKGILEKTKLDHDDTISVSFIEKVNWYKRKGALNSALFQLNTIEID